MSLLFVDTNVFLDFYRIRGSDPGMGLLGKLRTHSDRVISTTQVHDEFLTQRQVVLLRTVDQLNKVVGEKPVVPAILMGTPEAERLAANHAQRRQDLKKLAAHLKTLIADPREGDEVFFAVGDLTDDEKELCLGPENDEWELMVQLARSRRERGVPPGKADAHTIGDALNWEWLVHCAELRREDVTVVSRDSDYGFKLDGSWVVRERLSMEFNGLVDHQCSLSLTDKLSTALETLNVRVSESERDAEEKLIEQREAYQDIWLPHLPRSGGQAELWTLHRGLFDDDSEGDA